MTREEQDTERQLVRSEIEWLKARGWTVANPGFGMLASGARFAHAELVGECGIRDAVSLTRAAPLKFRRR